jgi:6-phosphogluconolactonase (cycloisomerase 2 family)
MVYSNYLFAVNPGSNSLSMFTISPSDATQLTLISVQPTNGWFSVSVTANSMYACVLTGGNVTGILCFTYLIAI